VRRSGIIAIKLQKEDQLGWAHLLEKGDHVILVTSRGQSIRFKESDVRKWQDCAECGDTLEQGDMVVGAVLFPTKKKRLFF